MKTAVVAMLTAGLALLGAENARADMMTEDFSFPAINNLSVGSSTTETSSVPEFNPALGTLNSVSITGAANITFVGADVTDINQYQISISLVIDGAGGGGSPFCSNPCTFPLSPTVDQSVLSDFIGVGSLTATMMYNNVSQFPVDLTFTNTVTYTYTPVAAVPAPSIGRGLPVLLAVGGLLFGAKLLERGKRRGLQFG
jgi:hypothetical protein